MASTMDNSFTIQLLKGRLFMVFSSIMILSFIGTSYIFGLYSSDIKSTLGYDQTTLNLLSFFKDLGTYVSVHAGLLTEVAPPWVVLCIGGLVNLVGYLMIWLSVTRRVPRPPVWQMCMYICIGANTMGFANSSALVTCVKNFPGGNRGVVIGILKGYIGIGGAIMAQLYYAIYGNSSDTAGVILLIAWLPALVSVLFAYSVRVLDTGTVDKDVKKERKFFNGILYMGLALAGFILVMIMVEKKVQFTRSGYAGTSAVIMVLLVLPILLVIREEWATWKAKRDRSIVGCPLEVKVVNNVGSKLQHQSGASSEDKHVPWLQDVFRPPVMGEDHTILQATFSIEMQILFLATVCGIGGHLTTIDNLGQIGKSLGYTKKSISTFVSLISIWQYLGRVLGGFISEHLLHKYKCPRPVCLTIILFLSSIGHLLIAFNVPYGLYISSIVIGFCFGAEWTALFTIISELFGLKYYATLYNYGSLVAPVGSYIFNVIVAGRLYDKEGIRQLSALGLVRKPGQELNCNGVKCYQLAYIIISGATLFSAVVSLILVVRTRDYYKGDIYKKFQEATNKHDQITTNEHQLSTENGKESSNRKDEDNM